MDIKTEQLDCSVLKNIRHKKDEWKEEWMKMLFGRFKIKNTMPIIFPIFQ